MKITNKIKRNSSINAIVNCIENGSNTKQVMKLCFFVVHSENQVDFLLKKGFQRTVIVFPHTQTTLALSETVFNSIALYQSDNPTGL